jgi:hypothetical protein
MIPIHQDERLEYIDEKDGVKYFFKALTGGNESKYAEIISRYSKDKPAEVIAGIENELVDYLLTGWEALDGRKVSRFPEDGKPSSCFGRIDKNKLIDLAMQVNHLTDAEVKN